MSERDLRESSYPDQPMLRSPESNRLPMERTEVKAEWLEELLDLMVASFLQTKSKREFSRLS